MKIQLLPYIVMVAFVSSCSLKDDASDAVAVSPSLQNNLTESATKQIKDFKSTKPELAVKSVKKPDAPSMDAKEVKVVPALPVVSSVTVPKKAVSTEFVKPSMPGARVSRVSVPDKVVALTFDDGPHGGLTPRVLDILERYNAKGTFFVLGSNAQSHPAILRRMVAGGHEVGNHTWNHINMSRSSRSSIESQLTRTSNAVKQACGVAPRVMRPPYGAANSSLCSWVKGRFGETAILWDVDTNDWRKPGVSTVISRAVNGARPGSIILVHDIHKSTVDAVEGIVRGLQSRGFKLVTVSELIGRGMAYASRSKSDVKSDLVVPAPAANPDSRPSLDDLLSSEPGALSKGKAMGTAESNDPVSAVADNSDMGEG